MSRATAPTGAPNKTEHDARVRAGLEQYLSQQTGDAVRIETLERPTANGFSADTFLLTLKTTALPSRLVVQAAPTEQGLFEHYDIARSYRVQEALGACDVPVAHMRQLCEDEDWIGAPFYVMDHVAGLVPSDRPPYHQAGWLRESEPDLRGQVWQSGIEAMAALHRVDPGEFKFLGDADTQDWAACRIDEWRQFGDALGPDTEPTLLQALESLREIRPMCGDLRVHWGDAKLGNMIFNHGRTAAILDWELCGLSVGEEDLGHWLAVDWFLSTGRGIDRLEGLPGAAVTVAGYEAATRHATNDVGWWFAFALVRMGLIFQRAAVQAKRHRGRPIRSNIVTGFVEQLVDGTIWAELSKSD